MWRHNVDIDMEPREIRKLLRVHTHINQGHQKIMCGVHSTERAILPHINRRSTVCLLTANLVSLDRALVNHRRTSKRRAGPRLSPTDANTVFKFSVMYVVCIKHLHKFKFITAFSFPTHHSNQLKTNSPSPFYYG